MLNYSEFYAYATVASEGGPPVEGFLPNNRVHSSVCREVVLLILHYSSIA